MAAQRFPGDLVYVRHAKDCHVWRVAEVAQNGDLLCESSRGWAYWFCPAQVVEAFGPFQEHNPAGIALADVAEGR